MGVGHCRKTQNEQNTQQSEQITKQKNKQRAERGKPCRSAGEIAVVRIYCLKINWVQPALRENPLKSAVRGYCSHSVCIAQA